MEDRKRKWNPDDDKDVAGPPDNTEPEETWQPSWPYVDDGKWTYVPQERFVERKRQRVAEMSASGHVTIQEREL